jgi:hypothetical protein
VAPAAAAHEPYQDQTYKHHREKYSNSLNDTIEKRLEGKRIH